EIIMNSARIGPVFGRRDRDNGIRPPLPGPTRPRDRLSAPRSRPRRTPMSITAALAPLRNHGGQRRTTGLDDATIERMAAGHPELREAIDAAAAEYACLKPHFGD